MAWYDGPSFISVLNDMIPAEPSDGNLLIPVETVYLKRIQEAPLILTGRIMRGNVTKGKEVQVIPLFDSSTTIHHPKMIKGRIKSIRSRATSHQLPWIGKIIDDDYKNDDVYEAGQVVGISLHLNPKYSWVKSDEGYFRKGCIITELNEDIEMGTVLSADVFLPFYSRLIKPGENWVVYLFGKNKGDALILSSTYEEGPFIDESGHELAGYLIKLQLLLNFTMAYPVEHEASAKYNKDIVLRHHESYCGGRINNLLFPETIDMIYPNDESKYNITDLRHIFVDLQRFNKLSCEWKIFQKDDYNIKVCIFNPVINDIIVCYKRLVLNFGNLPHLPFFIMV